MDQTWMIEEEEDLIRLDQGLDAVAGYHRAHCGVCWDTDGGFCEVDDILRSASALVTKATRIEQQRQDEEQPMPVYSPVKL